MINEEQSTESIEPRAWLLAGGRIYNDQVFMSHDFALHRQARRGDNARLVPLYAPQDEAEFNVFVGEEHSDELDFVAGTSGQRDSALKEALGYARKYAKDWRVEIQEIIRIPVKVTGVTGNE